MTSTNPAKRRFLKLAAVSAICGIFMLIHWLRQAPERALAKAREVINEGDPEKAAAFLEYAKTIDRTRPEAVLLLAEAAVATNQPESAVEDLESTQFPEAEKYRADYWKGRILLSVGQYLRALKWLEASAAQKPDDPDTWRWLVVAAYEIGDRDRAVQALRRITRLAPDDMRAWHTMAIIHKENNEPEEALAAYRSALQRPSFEREWLLEGAAVAIDLSDFDIAEAWLARLRDDFEPARQAVMRASMALKKGQTEAARDAIERDLNRFPDHPGLSALLATIRQAEGNPAQAERLFSVALAHDPFNADLLFQRAGVRRQIGKPEASKEDFEEANRIKRLIRRMSELNYVAAKNTTDAEVRRELGRIAETLGMEKLARDWYRAALACDPTIDVPIARSIRKDRQARTESILP